MPITAAIADVVSLLEQYNKTSGTWYMTKDLGNPFFSIPIRKEEQKEFAFTWDEQKYSFIVLPKTTLILHLSECSFERLYCLDILHNITLMHYIIVISVHQCPVFGSWPYGDPTEIAEE